MLQVLVVDDEPLFGEIFVDSFSTVTIQVTSVTTPEEALNISAHKKFDIAFIDYRMPSMTGDQLALKLSPQTYKVLITGEMEVDTEFDFAHVVKKPFDRQEIVKILDQYLLHKEAA